MDLNLGDLKGRIAEALVESIFRRAFYRVARIGRESQIPGMLKLGAGEFSPDFLVWKQVPGNAAPAHLHRLLAIEIKYRANLAEFVRRDLEPLVERVRDQWPELYCIVVTDNPEEGRSCFQVFSVQDASDRGRPQLVDLHEMPHLDIFRTTVEEYEGLVRAIFSLLARYAPARGESTDS